MLTWTRRLTIMALAVAVTLPAAASADDKYRVERAEVVIACPMTVGGTFEARTKDVTGELAPQANLPVATTGTSNGTQPTGPIAMNGAIVVNLQTLKTGIGLRDRHMRDKYLEVGKGAEFAVARLEQMRIEKLDGRTTFTAQLLLHGQRKAVTGDAELRQKSGRIDVQAQFPIRMSDFQIPPATYLGVGVQDELRVSVNMSVVPGAPLSVSR